MKDKDNIHKFSDQAEMLANRVKKKFKHLRKGFARENIDVFRLYDWDIPEIRAVVDWYAGHLVIAEYMRRQSVPEWLPMMAAAVGNAMDIPPENVHLKQRRAGRQDGMRYDRIDHTDEKLIVSERDLKFLINPGDFVDTGLFSDHRNTRKMIRQAAGGKDFLNLYCYTGAFTCYAAKGGAKRTVSVDRSEAAVNWALENFKLNNISEISNRLVHADTLDFLKKAKKDGETFDLAVVDPPSYSTTRNRNQSFDILEDHPGLLSATLALIRPGGTIFFSTNHQGFELHFESLKVSGITEITNITIPEDYIRNRPPIHRCWKITVP
jgi:23S rRNA (cytosine1962-C5)-methyltransferase